MSLLTPSRIREVINEKGSYVPNASRTAATRELLKEGRVAKTAEFDIFLSHSSENAADVRLIKVFLEAFGFRVYVDWIEDGDLDRATVNPSRANLLRTRIRRSTSLLFYVTESSVESRWTPWELGYADGLGKRVALLPRISDDAVPGEFPGVEYLGLYPHVEADIDADTGETVLAVVGGRKTVWFDHWLEAPRSRA